METRGSATGKSVPPQGAGDDKLRQLRDRAHAALAEQRRHMQELERRLVSQLENVATELAEDLADKVRDVDSAGPQEDERNILHRERVDWQAEQELAEAQMQSQLEDLRARDYELSQREQQFEVRWLEMTDQQDDLSESLAATQAEREALEQERRQLDERQGELAREQEELAAQRQATESMRAEVESLKQSQDERQAEFDRRDAELNDRASQLDRRGEELEGQSATLAERETQLAERETQLAQGQDSTLQELEERHAAERQAHEQQLGELKGRIAELEEQSSCGDEAATEWRQKYEAEKSEWDGQREQFVEERDKLSATLRELQQKLEEAQENASDEEYEELDQKFQLALADVQTLRQHSADLEQQLARRPEQGGVESAELVELRDERDLLLQRIEQLEQRAPGDEETDQSQELADLQRRFEMAVQDVRELRQENSKLKEQLDKQRHAGGSGVVDNGALDWEAQKRRLLASLEGEDGDFDADRDEERTTIEGTIRITDEVIGEKDRQIAELERQIREAAENPAAVDSLEVEREELLNSDELIQAERQKLAILQEQLNDALRKAELELSVERAKIARERTRMEELQEEVESLRRQGGTAGGERSGEKGRGRWLSKLGLSGDEPSP